MGTTQPLCTCLRETSQVNRILQCPGLCQHHVFIICIRFFALRRILESPSLLRLNNVECNLHLFTRPFTWVVNTWLNHRAACYESREYNRLLEICFPLF